MGQVIKISKSTRGRLFFLSPSPFGSGAQVQYLAGIICVVGTVQSVPCSFPGFEQGVVVSSSCVTNIPKLKGLKHQQLIWLSSVGWQFGLGSAGWFRLKLKKAGKPPDPAGVT